MSLECVQICKNYNEPCPCNDCKNWIDYEDDLNCSNVAAMNGPMTLEEIGKRLGITLVRVKQIEEEAMDKLKKRLIKLNTNRTI
jgi:hypothetical protein